MRAALHALPETEAPAGSWDRVVAQYRSEQAPQQRDWMGGFAVAAGAAIVAVLVLSTGGPETSPESMTTPQTASVTTSPLLPPSETTAIQPVSVNELKSRSHQLERRLASLPDRPRVVRAATVDTITQLQDRIAFVDYQLSRGGARGLSENDARLLWQQRVELMNTLWRVRSAEAQRNAF